MNQLFCIIIYAILWLVTSIIAYIKIRKINLATLLVTGYFITSLTSIYFYFNAPVSREIFNVTFGPFIFLYFCILITIYPILRYNKVLDYIYLPPIKDHHIVLGFLLVISPFIIDSFIELFLASLSADAISLSDAYETDANTVVRSLSKIGVWGYLISHYLAYLWPILFFYCLSQSSLYCKISIIALLAFMIEIMQGYVGGNRVTLVRFILYFFIVFALMKNNLSKLMLKRIKISSIVVLGIIISAISIITIVRLDGLSVDFDMQSFLSLYTGEGCIRFSQYIWELDKTSNGDTCFSLFKDLFGFDTFVDNMERRDYYEGYFKIPTYIFYTYIGDFVQDLGKIGTLLLCLFVNRVLIFILKINVSKYVKCNFITIFILSTILEIFYFGFMYYNFKTYSDQLQLFSSLIAVLLLNMFCTKLNRIYK